MSGQSAGIFFSARMSELKNAFKPPPAEKLDTFGHIQRRRRRGEPAVVAMPFSCAATTKASELSSLSFRCSIEVEIKVKKIVSGSGVQSSNDSGLLDNYEAYQ